MEGGTILEIVKISSSEITPGPLGILATRPNADAPKLTAILASSIELMQHIFTLVVISCLNFNLK